MENVELIEKIRTDFLKKLNDYHVQVPHYKHYGDEGCGMCIGDIKKLLDNVLKSVNEPAS